MFAMCMLISPFISETDDDREVRGIEHCKHKTVWLGSTLKMFPQSLSLFVYRLLLL